MRFKNIILIIIILLGNYNVYSQSRISISGTITDKLNGNALPEASVYIKELKMGVSSNSLGNYKLSFSKTGQYTFVISYISYKTIEVKVDVKSTQTINFEMEAESEQLNEAVVSLELKNTNVTRTEMSTERLQMKQVRLIPVLMGEVDLIKALQLLPGVQSTAEGTSGFSVRGGSPDQNLILLDEAIVYNASHLLGFFSVFNNDAVSDIKLYKGDIPAAQGGRLSSLLEVNSLDPSDADRVRGTGGVGIISSRLMIESPIQKGRSSFFIAGRRTYADMFLKLSSDEDLKGSAIFFYDLNAKVNYVINKNNRIYLSGYYGNDRFRNKETSLNFGNSAATLRWNHLFSNTFYLNLSATISNYNYKLKGETPSLSGVWNAGISGKGIRADFSWLLNQNNTLRFGISSVYHKFQPGNATAVIQDNAYSINIPRTQGLESAVFIQNQQQLTSKLSLKYGIRATVFQNIGPTKVFSHFDDDDTPVFDSYSSGDFFHNYWAVEPRIGLVYAFNDRLSVKSSYARTTQFLHLLSTSTAGSPLDIWMPVNPNIKPQRADQIAAGIFRNFANNSIETSLEGYYKYYGNVLDFKDHPNVFGNDLIEPELRRGKGESYGVEMMVRKNEGKLTGWISYTWSRAFRTIETINNNEPYSAPFDKPHNINIVTNYAISRRVSIGVTWIYSTGQPITFPEGRYVIGNDYIPIYSGRNKYRLPDYHRMDASLNIDLNKNPNKRWKSELNISVYNLYGRKNPWLINFRTDEDGSQYAQMTYLFSFIPSITYNFKF